LELQETCAGINHAPSDKFQKILERGLAEERQNPMVQASCVWAIVSDQLCDVLGNTIYNQWFANIKPLFISDNVIVLKTGKNFDVRWINSHYQNLIDVLLSFQSKNLTSFFVGPSDFED
jgi:hypothetical protein